METVGGSQGITQLITRGEQGPTWTKGDYIKIQRKNIALSHNLTNLALIILLLGRCKYT